MRRMACIGLSCLLLTACGGSGGGSSTADACVEQYWDGTVGTCLPAAWSIIPREKLTERGLPAEVIAAFERDEAVSGQTPVVLVTREVLAKPLAPKEYSDAAIRSVATLPGYERIDERNQKVDSENVTIHIYTAKPQTGEPAHRFYQLSTAKDTMGFTFTALGPVSISSGLEKELLTMLQHATLHEPVVGSE